MNRSVKKVLERDGLQPNMTTFREPPKRLSWKTKTTLGAAGLTLLGALGIGHMQRQANHLKKTKVAVVKFERDLPSGKKLANVFDWVMIAERYGLNPTNKQHEQWMRAINALSVKCSLSPERVINTLRLSDFTASGARSREVGVIGHEERIANASKQGGRVHTNAAKLSRAEIIRLRNISTIVETVQNDPRLQRFRKHIRRK
jgi:hypothetical protein